MHSLRFHILITSAVLTLIPSQSSAKAVSFRNEVMAVLSRAGCNQGACHGNQNGKNGFRLSLRGQDPAWDILALKRDTFGRRVNLQKPEASLLLLKPLGHVPHEGGKRYDTNSREHQLLLQWIREGGKDDLRTALKVRSLTVTPEEKILIEPESSVQLKVMARFSDGSERDVTHLAVYETFNDVAQVTGEGLVQKLKAGESTILVRYLSQQVSVLIAFVPSRPDFVWEEVPEINYIDKHVFAKLKKLRIHPSQLCSDEEFLRRAHLDLIGTLPTSSEVKAFLKNNQANKRSLLIDALLKRPEFVDFWALKWGDVLRNEEKVLDRTGVKAFHGWIRKSIAENKPLNRFAYELLTAKGSTYKNPPANYYRALRDPQIRAETTAQVFLGRRIQCARCHNHPFDQWTQDDYYGMAAFFARINYKIVKNERKDKFDKHEFVGEQIVQFEKKGEVKNPTTGQVTSPHVLGEPGRSISSKGERVDDVAKWIADPNNPFFAQAQVNRIWYHLMGRGIVHPIDDFKLANPPVNEPLLNALADDFRNHNFDLRSLIRVMMNSRTYQLSSTPNDTNVTDETNFSRALIRPLQAEVLLDALAKVTQVPSQFTGYSEGMRAIQIPGVRAKRARDSAPTDADRFLQLFGKPPRSLACECERSEDVTLGQAFQMITGKLLNEKLTRKNNRLGQMQNEKLSEEKILDELYLSALSRYPTKVEKQTALALISQSDSEREAWEDVLWSILSAKEFLLRR